jgi:hypothetical protein
MAVKGIIGRISHISSGKHRVHGMNVQVVASPDGTIVWVSGGLPGSVHDTAAARIWNILAALRETGLIALGDRHPIDVKVKW